jgi:inner membrane protein
MRRRSRAALFSCVFLANAADLDFLAALIGIGTHRGITHSIPFAIAVSVVIGLLAHWLCRKPFHPKLALSLFGLTLLIYGSHLFLDFYTMGGSGMTLFAPFSAAHFQATHPIFPSVHHSEGLFYEKHLDFILFESLYSAIALSSLWLWKNRKSSIIERATKKLSNVRSGLQGPK